LNPNGRLKAVGSRVLLPALIALGVAGAGTEPSDADPVVVCIDPGHPSEVSLGDERLNGTTEVHVAWTVAVKLRADLEARGITVCMTKDKQDTLVRNRERAEVANRAGAALLVRLHCDTGRDSGFVVYYPDRVGTAEGRTGPSDSVRARSERAAEIVHAAMAGALRGRLHDGGILGDSKTFIGEKQGALTGSIFSNVPVLTIEMVVLSHRSDAEFIRSDSGIAIMATAIADGAARFVAESR
jgi:N-acetylmuramoyl-L-alanine amidase